MLMPICRPLKILKDESVKTLLQFSATAGVLPKGADKNFDFAGSISGPIPSVVISAVGSEDEKTSNLTIISSYGALTQDYLASNALNNSAYFVNMVNKLSSREDTGVTIESKSIGGNELGLNKATADAIGVIVAVVLPLVVLALGVFMFFRRKNK